LTELTFTATATDSDIPANTLTFSLAGAPEGALIDSSTGIFTWTPTEAQGPDTHSFTVVVCDNTAVPLCDEEPITVTVNVSLVIEKTGTGTGTVTSDDSAINCGLTCSTTYSTETTVILTATPTDQYHQFIGWSGADCNGTDNCTVEMTEARLVTAEFGLATFSDVPFDHPRWLHIQTLWENGFTSGCQAEGEPFKFCPEDTMIRGESAVFMVRGELGAIPSPVIPEPSVFGDDWTYLEWAQSWAEKMWDLGMTAGCQWPADSEPKLFCQWSLFTREMGAVFALRMKHGADMIVPPGTGEVFADMTDPDYWGTGWAEMAYAEGLLPNCGIDVASGKPNFCPQDELDRSWSAYTIVLAKDLLP